MRHFASLADDNAAFGVTWLPPSSHALIQRHHTIIAAHTFNSIAIETRRLFLSLPLYPLQQQITIISSTHTVALIGDLAFS